MTNSTQNATKIYDVHTTGFGYLNRIREVTPRSGDKYLSCDITLQEGVAKDGDFSKINKIYLQANVVGKKAIEVMREHFTNDNGLIASPDKPVTAAVRLGGLDVDTFVYQKGEKAGQTGVQLKTRLLKLSYLAIDSNPIDLGDDDGDDESGGEVNATDDSVTESDAQTESQAPEEAESTEVDAEETQPVSVRFAESTSEDEVAYSQEVALDRDDPEFDAKRAQLKQLGYRWKRKPFLGYYLSNNRKQLQRKLLVYSQIDTSQPTGCDVDI